MIKQCLFLRLSSSIGNQMCYVQLVASGFLSSSTHEIIQDAISHQWHFLCCQSIYLLHQFCWANHVHIPQVFKDCSQTLYMLYWSFPFWFSLNVIEVRHLWFGWLGGIQWRVYIHDYCCFQCQNGCFDLLDSTAFMDIGCTLLYSETPPSLVIVNW